MPKNSLPSGLVDGTIVSALAPMQDVTTLPFMEVINHYGPPDYFFTEYFRVHEHSTLEKHILESITKNTSGRPVFAQMIGESLDDLKRTAKALSLHPVAGIDLNMGCPAPKVYRKNVGGGLLRDPEHVEKIFATLRETISGLFTVKMRIGFDDTNNFETILNLVNKYKINLLTLHARTVKQMYRGEVHYDYIKHAQEQLECPVIANGNITSAEKGIEVQKQTGAFGIMIGRSAIRNPWIFRQFRELCTGETAFQPRLSNVREYIDRLYQATASKALPEKHHCNFLKKFLNFIGQSVDPEGQFLKSMRRSPTYTDLFKVCDEFLLLAEDPIFPNEPYQDVIARPNCEI